MRPLNEIAYIPIDTGSEDWWPDESEIINYFLLNCTQDLQLTKDHDYGRYHRTALLATSDPPEDIGDWRRFGFIEKSIMHNYIRMAQSAFANSWDTVGGCDAENLAYAPGFKEKFPEIVKVISKLPFKRFCSISMAHQCDMSNEVENNFVPPHNSDTKMVGDNPVDIAGKMPTRYMIYLTNPRYSTFYLTRKRQGVSHWQVVAPGITIPPAFTESCRKTFPIWPTPLCCFDNDEVLHGTVRTRRPRVVLNIYGIIDVEKHHELLKRSFEKYKDYVIYRDDLNLIEHDDGAEN